MGFVGYIERKFQERKARNVKESPADKGVRVTASATVWMAVFTFVLAFVGIATLVEIIEGGQDTHDLAVAAAKQADAAGKQAERMKDFADRMKDQADRTRDLAAEAKAQAIATKKSADIAHDALTRSARPWVGVESLRVTQPIGFVKAGDDKDPTYFISGTLEIVIKNFGSSPALSVNTFVEAYDPSMFPKEKFDPKEPFAQLRKFGESTCALANGNDFTKKSPKMFGGSMFPTQGVTYTAGIAGFAKQKAQGSEWIQLVGCIVYRDQFGEKPHRTNYCFIAPIGSIVSPVHGCESNSDAN